MRKLIFADTEEFYQKLSYAVTTGETIELHTDYTRFGDLPTHLKQIFQLNQYKTDTWVSKTSSSFIPKSFSSVGLSSAYLSKIIINGSTTAGEVFGSLCLGSLGVIIGRTVGLTAGIFSSIFKKEDYAAKVAIDSVGHLTILLEEAKTS
ncbi:hypothetical protein [Gloeothece verrucosa]|nr:hypothetical protein [Gloeothece verrucosa]